jgi:hypothetical protein
MSSGWRSYISWMDQRRLEYAYRLRLMAPSRLPRRVAAAAWPAKPALRRPCLHSEVVAALIADTCLDLAAEQAAACSYAQLKQRAAAAVRKRDMRVTRRAD